MTNDGSNDCKKTKVFMNWHKEVIFPILHILWFRWFGYTSKEDEVFTGIVIPRAILTKRCVGDKVDLRYEIFIKIGKEPLEMSPLNRVFGVLACFACSNAQRASLLGVLACLRSHVIGVVTYFSACVVNVFVWLRLVLLAYLCAFKLGVLRW